ncbi:MAG TPA: cation-translocating P-type ATPase [Dissulfurispiraceae bacterium]|nr:cation-translocating P-type ATPase [Dissulfurispiraceae bacterium]
MSDFRLLFAERKFRHLVFSLAIVLPLEILSLSGMHLEPLVRWSVIIGILALLGRGLLLHGIRSLVRFDFSDINLLMTIAVAGALYLGELEEAAVIVTLFSLGEALEEFGLQRSRAALESLIQRVPQTAKLKGDTERTAVERITVGDVIEIRPGEVIPLDGAVIAGTSLVEEATITGEPLPKSKDPGDSVYAGTMNTQGYLEVRVAKTQSDTTLARIIALTEEAAEKKASTQRFIERFAKYYTPAVVFGAAALVVLPVVLFGEPLAHWLPQALSLLIISCPCALVISTPIVVFSAIGNASRHGIVVKGGRFVEALGTMRAIAFDKTRTLTVGRPVVSDVRAFGTFRKEEVLACAAGLEVFSEHPIAQSIVDKSEEHALAPHPFEEFQAVPGKGVKGVCTICTDPNHCLGSMKYVAGEHHVPDDVAAVVRELESHGKTVVVISDSVRVKGVIGVTDSIREESRSVLDEVRSLGVQTFMLTGDNASAGRYVADLLGIRDVKAGLLPQDKALEMQELITRFGTVGMVGDGVNDAPALAAASVGIGMGAAGSDLALENSDIALMHDRLDRIPFLINLGRRCLGTIRFNITAAIAVKALFLGLAVSGLSNLALAIFADVGVTVLVILNGLRLYHEAEVNPAIEKGNQ